MFLSCNIGRRNHCFLTVALFIILTPYITNPQSFCATKWKHTVHHSDRLTDGINFQLPASSWKIYEGYRGFKSITLLYIHWDKKKEETLPNESAKIIYYFLVLTLNNLFRNSWWVLLYFSVWDLCFSPQISVEPGINHRGMRHGQKVEEASNQSSSLPFYSQ